MCNAYVYETEGGKTEVKLRVKVRYRWGTDVFKVDNRTRRGGLVENKCSATTGRGSPEIQLLNYLRYLDENGGSLDYYYFRSPTGSPVGPSYRFASLLADAATRYDLGVRIIDHDWWEELQ